MFKAADPGHCTLDAHAEARMWDGAVVTQVQIPFEGFVRQAVFVDALHEQFMRGHSLSTADYFAIAFGREYVDAERNLGPFRIRFHVKGFHLAG